jgi:hypothetical protein
MYGFAAVDAFLDGGTRAPAILGEPGIGKSTVSRVPVERVGARGAIVLVARPAESEARLSFADAGAAFAFAARRRAGGHRAPLSPAATPRSSCDRPYTSSSSR